MTERSPTLATVDLDNPWPGLASFTEETRAFFHGRDREVTELFRRVQRKPLTILFGQSGHGKSSLLRAGLVPRLRPEGYCPIYVRLDHTPGSMSLSEQIKETVFRVTAETGTWTKPGASVPGESLWEFLHHRDDQLKDATGNTLIPLIIFDQFEEIFTLAQTDATGRARAEAFVTDLADLVENRPPLTLEERLEQDPSGADRFDFDRADYRLLISLREDYLPHLEGLKSRMPSVTQNRVRLARMSGTQALESVLKTGGRIVSDEVAKAIVLFISGANDVAHAEVEPSLLSLVCRELNETRKARGQDAITADLLEGSRESILAEYYERTLADVPTGVRLFIEDHLLTDSGFRESVAEERVKKAFAAAGAPTTTLPALVNHRLLRIEERLDVRRVELTHDVLCGIVKTSRESRLARAALRRARRLRLMVAGLAAGLIAVVGTSVAVAIRSKRAALEAAQRSSRSDFTYGSQFLEEGKVPEGLAYLARAAKSDPLNYAVGPRLISALTSRPFTVPVGSTYVHAGFTVILGFSADGKRLATSSDDNTISFWDVASGRRLLDPVGLGALRRTQAFDASHTRLAVAALNGTLRVFEVATGRLLLGPLQTGPQPLAVAFSPDGRWLAAGCQSKEDDPATVKLWDAGTGELRATFPMKGWVSSLDFSPDSSRLLATDFRKLWRIWDVPSGRQLTPDAEFSDVQGQANLGRFSPDGRLVVITDMAGAQMWDWAAHLKVGQRLVHGARSDVAEFSSDGSLLFTAGGDGTSRVWRVPSGLPVSRADITNNSRGSRAFSSDGRRLLTINSPAGTVHLLDAVTGKPLIEPLRSSFFTSAVFSPDEKEIWTSDRDGIVRRWRAGASAASPLELNFNETSGGAFTVAEKGPLLIRLNNRLEYRDIETGAESAPGRIHPAQFRDMVRTPDGAFAAGVLVDGKTELWDYRRQETVERRPLAAISNFNAATATAANLFKFSSDGTRLAQIAKDERVVSIWESDTGRLLGEIHTGEVYAESGVRFDFDPSRNSIAIGDIGGNLGVFDVSTGKQVGETVRHGLQINAIAFSPDGTRIASTGNSRKLRLTDSKTGRDIRPPVELPGSGSLVWFSNDGRFVTVRTPAVRQIHFWDTQTGVVRSIPIPDGTIFSDDKRGRFDPGAGRFGIVSLETGTVRVWSAATGQQVIEPIQASGAITGAPDFSSDRRFIVTRVDGRPTMDIWPVAPLESGSGVPTWLPRLAVAVAGGAINDAGEFRASTTAPGEFAALKAELAALPDTAPYVKWGRWFLADPEGRSISPESPLSRAQALAMADTDPLAGPKAKETQLRTAGSWADAEVAARDILARLQAGGDRETAEIGEQLTRVALNLNGETRFAEAEPLAREALRIRQALLLTNEEESVLARLALGDSLLGQKKFPEAERELLAAYNGYTRTGTLPAGVRATAGVLGRLYRETNRPQDATLWEARGTVNTQ